jgi:hypothetical protein
MEERKQESSISKGIRAAQVFNEKQEFGHLKYSYSLRMVVLDLEPEELSR